MPKKFNPAQEEFIEGVQQGLGVAKPESTPGAIDYSPVSNLAYELAKRRIGGQQVPAPGPDVNIKSQDEVQQYFDRLRQFPELANQLPPQQLVLKDSEQAQHAGSQLSREEILRKIREQSLGDEDVAARRIRLQQEREDRE